MINNLRLFAGPICDSDLTCLPLTVAFFLPYVFFMGLAVAAPLLVLHLAIKRHMPNGKGIVGIVCVSIAVAVPSAVLFAPTIYEKRTDGTYSKQMQAEASAFKPKAYEPTSNISGYTLVESGVGTSGRSQYAHIYYTYYETAFHEKSPDAASPVYYKLILISSNDIKQSHTNFCPEASSCETGILQGGNQFMYGNLGSIVGENSPISSAVNSTERDKNGNNAFVKLPTGVTAIVISSDLQKSDFEFIFSNLKEISGNEINYRRYSSVRKN